ncbi:MAG: ATP-binding protein [Gammaproteobacteria bacterium]
MDKQTGRLPNNPPTGRGGGKMRFDDLLNAVQQVLETEGRTSYRGLKRRFSLSDDVLEDVKAELIDAKRLARDEEGRVLVWVGNDGHEGAGASRRQLSVMFCDVVGSTALSSRLDPEELRDLLRSYQSICGRIIAAHGGYVAQYLGDGLLVYFGYPKALEGAARRAIEAGLDIIRNIHESADLRLNKSEHLRVRIGIHTGLVVIGEMGDEHHYESLAVGETPNIAARVQGLAEPNQLVVSDNTRKVAGEDFDYNDVGAQTLKGISAPMQLWRVLDRTAETMLTRTLTSTALVGRENELADLSYAWTNTELGNSNFLLVTGEPGVGKTRLVDEIERRATALNANAYTLQCDLRFSNSPYYPVIKFLTALIDVNDSRWGAEVSVDDVPYLQALLGRNVGIDTVVADSPELRRAKTMQALIRWLGSISFGELAICRWEDMHAADPSTVELFARLTKTDLPSPVMHIATARPGTVVDELRLPTVQHVDVSPLDATRVRELASATARDKVLASEVLERISATTDGVPLFVEELTKMLVESNWLREERGRYVFSEETRSLAIPVTLQDSLMARLDNLPAGLKVAQCAATIGREFDAQLLGELVEPHLQDNGISQLLGAGLIEQTGTGSTQYRFKHALVGEAAYQSLLKSERRVYHGHIADALGRVTPAIAKAHPELVAHHWTEAGNADRALPFWQAAGELAARRSANQEALHHLETGLNTLNLLPHTVTRDQYELTLRKAMGPVLIAVKGNAAAEVEMCYERARELCDVLGDNEQAFAATFGLRSYYLARANLAHSHELGKRLLDIGVAGGSADEQLEAHVALSNTYFFHGNFEAVQQHVDAGNRLYRQDMHSEHVRTYGLDPGVICLSRAAQALWHRGFADRAVRRMEEAIALAERLQHPFTSAYLYDNVAVLYQWRREGESARSWAETAVEISNKYNFPFFKAWGLLQAGAALVELDHINEGVAQMEEGMALADSIGVLLMQPWFLATRAEACLKKESLDEGLKFVADGLAIVENTGAVYAAPALNWLQGELLIRSSANQDSKMIDQYFLQSKLIADEHGSVGFALRAVMALCRLWQRHGKFVEARNLLEPIYRSFTEGFETPDLKDAKVLLDELA